MTIPSKYKDLVSTFITQVWRLFSGPLMVLMIPLFLAQEQQGFWYLFTSLGALSVFADLGFSNIILQFSAHEFAFLSFTSDSTLVGDDVHLKRLGSFFRFVCKWLLAICCAVFPVIFVIGIVFFCRDGVLSVYGPPWALYSLGTIVYFVANSILSYVEGLDRIASVQKIRFLVSVISTLITVSVLYCGGGVYALALGMLISSLGMLVITLLRHNRLFSFLLRSSRGFAHSWRKEVLPLFTRYALSFASGYFIFQIYTPLMHYFHGPVFSGKVGISLSLVSAAFGLCNIWMYTITPKINMLVSQGDWIDLDRLFRKRLMLSLATYFIIIVGLVGFIALFGHVGLIAKITSRFLPVSSLVMLFICYFLQIFVNAWALYLRGHKQEPFVIPSLLSAVWIAVSSFLAGSFLPPEFFFLGFFSSYLWGVPVCYVIFRVKRKLWHR